MSYRVCHSCRHVFVEAMVSHEEVIAGYRSRDSHHSSELKEIWDYSQIKDELVYGPLLDKIGRLKRSGREQAWLGWLWDRDTALKSSILN